jgi:hypothetical protein
MSIVGKGSLLVDGHFYLRYALRLRQWFPFGKRPIIFIVVGGWSFFSLGIRQWFPNVFTSRTIKDKICSADDKLSLQTILDHKHHEPYFSLLKVRKNSLGSDAEFWWSINGPRTSLWETLFIEVKRFLNNRYDRCRMVHVS